MTLLNVYRIKEWMLDRLWKVPDLAVTLGYSETYIYMLFAGQRQPSREFMERLVSVTNLPLDTLFIIKNNVIKERVQAKIRVARLRNKDAKKLAI